MLLRKGLIQKFIKYSLVGCIGTIIYFLSVFVLVERFYFDPVFGAAIAFIIMTIASFSVKINNPFGL